MSIETNTTLRDAAITYARAGVAVIPLHHVGDDGACSCREWAEHRNPDHGPGGKQTGKHPVQKRWAAGEALTVPDVWAVWEEWPRANIGLRTGPVSGFWVLDVDPVAGGDASLTKLVGEVGGLSTYTVRTGSGGLHFYFAMPAFPVRNSANRELLRRFGPGLDVRGDGGQVVAPPSVSGRGSYLVAHGFDSGIQAAPVALLELMQASGEVTTALPDTAVVEDLPTVADLDPPTRHRVQRYAERVLELEVRAYADAPPGQGNEQLFRSACAVLEVAQSPWNLLTAAQAYEAMDAGRARRRATHPYGGGQDDQEFATTWASATNRVVGQGRPLPPDPGAGTAFDPGPPPRPEPPPGAATLTVDAPGGMTAYPEQPRPAAQGLPGVGGVHSGPQHRPSMPLAVPVSLLDRLTARTRARSELASIRPPTPLIRGVLDAGTMAVLAGKFGTFKSFVALGWLCSLATGVPWLGHAVPAARPVVLVAAEGASGLDARITAWERAHGTTVPDGMLSVVDAPVQLGDMAQVDALAELTARRGAALVVIDTLHRCAAGLDEGDSKDMGLITLATSVIRQRADATTLLLHHTGHAGTRARGSSAIEDDADTSWVVSLTGDGEDRDPRRPRLMEQRKTKDAALAAPFHIRFQAVPEATSGHLTLSDRHGLEIPVPVGADPFTSPGPQHGVAPLVDENDTNRGLQTLVQVYLDVFREANGGTKAEVKTQATGKPYNLSAATFYRAWNRAVERGIVARVTGTNSFRYIPPEHREGWQAPGPV